MMMTMRQIGLAMAALMTVACTEPPPVSLDEHQVGQSSRNGTDSGTGGGGEAAGGPVANLPFAHGRTFTSLDEYLAHLERNAGPVGQPYWRQVRPGVYERVTNLRSRAPERATRAELMERFGFSR